MRRQIRTLVAVALALLGIVWIAQGVGILPGSVMSGQLIWAVIGAGLLVVSGALLWSGRRARA